MEPDDGEPLEIPAPHWVEAEDWTIGFTWAFGPQGHPASMRVNAIMFAEDGWVGRLWVHGPKMDFRKEPMDPTRLADALAYGARIESEFGSDPQWWRCSPTCGGMTPAKEPPYRPCPHCEAVRHREESRAADWFNANPMPSGAAPHRTEAGGG